MSSVGIQLTTTFASGRQTATFYDMCRVSDIVINEAVTMVHTTFLTQWNLLYPQSLGRQNGNCVISESVDKLKISEVK